MEEVYMQGKITPAALLDKEDITKKWKRSSNEKQLRSALEIKMGDKNFKIDPDIEGNPVAKARWDELIKLISDPEIDFITSSDSALLNRYCMCYAIYKKCLAEAKAAEPLISATNDIHIYKMQLDFLKIAREQVKLYSDHLIKLEDRLYLSPAAKVSAAGKVRQMKGEGRVKEVNPLHDAGFTDL